MKLMAIPSETPPPQKKMCLKGKDAGNITKCKAVKETLLEFQPVIFAMYNQYQFLVLETIVYFQNCPYSLATQSWHELCCFA